MHVLMASQTVRCHRQGRRAELSHRERRDRRFPRERERRRGYVARQSRIFRISRSSADPDDISVQIDLIGMPWLKSALSR